MSKSESVDKLRSDLTDAMEFQRVYDIKDEAKKRAIKTAVGYDNFREIVAASDLKSLDRGEFSAPPKQKVFSRSNGGNVTSVSSEMLKFMD